MDLIISENGRIRREYPSGVLVVGQDRSTFVRLLPRFVPRLSFAGEDVLGLGRYHFHASPRTLPFLLRPLLSPLFPQHTATSSVNNKGNRIVRG
jgi:hypothetical protein